MIKIIIKTLVKLYLYTPNYTHLKNRKIDWIFEIIEFMEPVLTSVGIDIQKLNKIHLYLYCFLV